MFSFFKPLIENTDFHYSPWSWLLCLFRPCVSSVTGSVGFWRGVPEDSSSCWVMRKNQDESQLTGNIKTRWQLPWKSTNQTSTWWMVGCNNWQFCGAAGHICFKYTLCHYEPLGFFLFFFFFSNKKRPVERGSKMLRFKCCFKENLNQ